MTAGAPPRSRRAASSAGRSRRPAASRENVCTVSRPIPRIASALSALGWTKPLESTGTAGRPASPSAPTSRPWRSPHHWRAAASPMRLAVVAPVERAPPHSAGSSKSSFSQSTATRSSRVPSGEPTLLKAFWSSAAGVTPPVTKWKKRGPGEPVAASSPPSSSSSAATAPVPSSGSGPPKRSAASSTPSGSTGRSSRPARKAEASSYATRAAAAVSSARVTALRALEPPLVLVLDRPAVADPGAQPRQLEDLEQDHEVERGGHREHADERHGDRRPQVPLAALAERDEARGERRACEHGAPCPEVDHGLPLGEAAADEAVVQVCLVGREHRLAVLQAPRHYEGRVDDGDGEDEEREEKGHGRGGLERSLDRHRREDEAEEHRAGVPHEDPRRVEVVAQEAEAGAGHDRGQDGGVRTPQRERDDGERPAGDRAHTGREPVEPVEEVDHVHDRHDPDERRDDGHPVRQRLHAHQREREVGDRDAGLAGDPGRAAPAR